MWHREHPIWVCRTKILIEFHQPEINDMLTSFADDTTRQNAQVFNPKVSHIHRNGVAILEIRLRVYQCVCFHYANIIHLLMRLSSP